MKIEAKDLRVGNTLNYITAEGYVLHNTIDWQDIKWIREDLKGFNMVHFPIPLTEIELNKLQLTRHIGWDDMAFWCLESDIENDNRFELFEGINGFESPSGALIKDVHTLQNCFYFHYLNGQELTYTT